MAAVVTEENLKDRWLGRRRKIFLTALSVAVIAHLIFGIISAVWIVSRYLAKPQATFVSKPPVRIPPQVLDPKLQAAEFEAAARKPVLDQKLASIKPVDFSLPDVPRTPVAELVEVDPSAIISPSATGLTGQMGGMGTGQGGGGGGAGTLDFFGVKTKGQRFVFVIDISGSMVPMKNLDNFEPIVQEVTNALGKLTPEQEFGLVLFANDEHPYRRTLSRISTSSVEDALKFMARYNPGTEAKKQVEKGAKEIKWPEVHRNTRVDLALERAFDMKPDVIIVLSDGEPSLGGKDQVSFKGPDGKKVAVKDVPTILAYVKDRQSEVGGKVIINSVSYRAGGGKGFLSKLAAENGGTYKDIK